MHIDFHDRTKSVPTDSIDLLQKLILFTAEKEAVPREAEISIAFVNNKEIQELNRNYRQQDKPTDVISFALQEPIEDEINIVGEDIPLALGDIVISVDKVEEQALDYNHPYDRELGFLAVHGFLHLLGYNHEDKTNEEKMFQKQTDIFGEFGLER